MSPLEGVRLVPAVVRSTSASIDWMVRAYVRRVTSVPTDTLPGGADLTVPPPVSILSCELEDLRPSAELLATHSADSEVAVALQMSQGSTDTSTSPPRSAKSPAP